MARLALQQSQNPQMRALSERIMRDHTRMNAELVKISGRRHAERASPPVMVKEIEQMQAHLGPAARHGMMVADHRRAIAMSEQETQDSCDQAVRDFARKEVGRLREQLELANELLSSGKPRS